MNNIILAIVIYGFFVVGKKKKLTHFSGAFWYGVKHNHIEAVVLDENPVKRANRLRIKK